MRCLTPELRREGPLTRLADRPDPHTPEQRRLNMSRIRSKDTGPEMRLRRALHARGFRYRLHDRRLAGSPDLVLPGRRAVVFVHGCFWHGHDCPYGVTPNTRTEFWLEKIARNRKRDTAAERRLAEDGWRVLTVWECALRGRTKLPFDVLIEQAADFLNSSETTHVIRGTTDRPADTVLIEQLPEAPR